MLLILGMLLGLLVLLPFGAWAATMGGVDVAFVLAVAALLVVPVALCALGIRQLRRRLHMPEIAVTITPTAVLFPTIDRPSALMPRIRAEEWTRAETTARLIPAAGLNDAVDRSPRATSTWIRTPLSPRSVPPVRSGGLGHRRPSHMAVTRSIRAALGTTPSLQEPVNPSRSSSSIALIGSSATAALSWNWRHSALPALIASCAVSLRTSIPNSDQRSSKTSSRQGLSRCPPTGKCKSPSLGDLPFIAFFLCSLPRRLDPASSSSCTTSSCSKWKL